MNMLQNSVVGFNRHVNAALDSISRPPRKTIEVAYEPSGTHVLVLNADPEQDPRPGKVIVFMQAADNRPFDFDSLPDEADLPF